MGDEDRNGESPPQSSAELDAFVEDMLEQMVRRISRAPHSCCVPFHIHHSHHEMTNLTLLIHCALRIVLHHIHALLSFNLTEPIPTANSFQRHVHMGNFIHL